MILVVLGLFVLGFNVAVVAHAREIVQAVLAWRLFIVGKSGLTTFVIAALWANRHEETVSWRIPLATFSMTLTLLALALLERSYRHRRNGHLHRRSVHD